MSGGSKKSGYIGFGNIYLSPIYWTAGLSGRVALNMIVNVSLIVDSFVNFVVKLLRIRLHRFDPFCFLIDRIEIF